MQPVLSRIERILEMRSTYRALIALNFLVVLGMMWATRNTMLSDAWSYIGLAEGILHGEYSMWWPLEGDYPDTFRTPGYPLVLAAVIALFGTWKAIIPIQFVLYWVAVFLMLKVIERYDGRMSVRSLFLLLLLPMVNVPFYITQIYTEIPVLAAISMALYIGSRPGRWTWSTALMLGLLYGFIFQCRPVFLLFPFLQAVIAFLMERTRFDRRGYAVMLGVFVLTLLPYGSWNLKNHGTFRVTPIQGGPGYMHFSMWCGKMPGYTDTFSLRNFTGDEIVRFVPEEDVPGYIAEYEKEWTELQAHLNTFLTAKDTAMFNARPDMPYPLENTYNTAYTLERERRLAELSFDHMLRDPWYTVAYKSYSAVRLWVIGIQVGDFRSASMMGKLKMLYATLVTGIMFLLMVVLVPWALWKRRLDLRSTWVMLLYLVYFGVFHIPFTIQARYTTPVRFVMLAMIGLAIISLFRNEQLGKENSDGNT